MIQATFVVVLDFETTDLSPNMGGCVIKIGVVKRIDGQVIDGFQQPMNTDFRVTGVFLWI